MNARPLGVVAIAAHLEELWRTVITQMLGHEDLLAAVDDQRVAGRTMDDWRAVFYALLAEPPKCVDWTERVRGASGESALSDAGQSEQTILLFLAERAAQEVVDPHSVANREADRTSSDQQADELAEGLADDNELPRDVFSQLETVGRVIDVLDSPDQQSILAVLRDGIWGISLAEVNDVPLRSVRLASRYPGIPIESPVSERMLWLNQLYVDRLTIGLDELMGRVLKSMWVYVPQNDQTEALVSALVSTALADGASAAILGRLRRLVHLVLDGSPERSVKRSIVQWGTDGVPRLTFAQQVTDFTY